MATSYLPNIPTTLEIVTWLNTECPPADAEILRDAAESYSLWLRDQFTSTTKPSALELHRVTDAWMQDLVERDAQEPIKVKCILGMAILSFNSSWITTHLGPTFWSLNIPHGPPGRALLFAYLIWRYELRKVASLSVAPCPRLDSDTMHYDPVRDEERVMRT
ncbi:hypothetical protein F5Y03DRAFT_349988 [Xylaria venustula]|nr:hypothetical protein F5Y03DRAFT_349988 [Xylaria venustula]